MVTIKLDEEFELAGVGKVKIVGWRRMSLPPWIDPKKHHESIALDTRVLEDKTSGVCSMSISGDRKVS